MCHLIAEDPVRRLATGTPITRPVLLEPLNALIARDTFAAGGQGRARGDGRYGTRAGAESVSIRGRTWKCYFFSDQTTRKLLRSFRSRGY